MKYTNWERARINAEITEMIKKHPDMFNENIHNTNAKIKVENLCNETDKNYIVESFSCKPPGFWRQLYYYLFR